MIRQLRGGAKFTARRFGISCLVLVLELVPKIPGKARLSAQPDDRTGSSK
jgi:hypothetical protein